MKQRRDRNILIYLLAFLSIGALFGGGVLIISPSGELIGMPLSLLNNSPFRNFLIPGIILFLLLGIIPIWVMYALIYKPENKMADKINFFSDMHWSWSFSIYIAFTLIIWIQLEIVIINAVSWLHTFYILYAICIILVTLLPKVRNLYKKKI